VSVSGATYRSGAEVGTARRMARLSLAQVASRMGCGKAYIYNVENAAKVRSEVVERMLDAIRAAAADVQTES
jgi:transcriptional regulator with XRE-family HTH domain